MACGAAAKPPRYFSLLPSVHFLGSAPAARPSSPSFIPAIHPHRRRAQGRSRPAVAPPTPRTPAPPGRGLRGPSTAACSIGLGEDHFTSTPTIKRRGSSAIELRYPAYIASMTLPADLFSKIFESRCQNADWQLVAAVRLGRAGCRVSKPSFSSNKHRSIVASFAVPQYVGKAACQMPAAAFARAAGGRSTMAAAKA